MRSKIAVCWLCVCLFPQSGAVFDRLPLVRCPPWGARPPSTLTQPFLLQLLVMSTATPFVSPCIWLSSAVHSRFTGTLPRCLCVSLSVVSLCLELFYTSGYVFSSLLGLFCISLFISFHFPVLCSFSITSGHSSLRCIFRGCFIIQENNVAVFFHQDK